MTIFRLGVASLLLLSSGLCSCGGDDGFRRVRVRLENVSDTAGYVVGANPAVTGLSPGLVVADDESGLLYRVGALDLGLGLEVLAERGAPFELADELAARGYPVTLFELADVSYAEGGIHPGESYTVEVDVPRGGRLHVATMFGESNDWLVATPQDGLSVDDLAVGDTRDVSSALVVVDVGTEEDEALFAGANQGPRQATPTSGTDVDVPVSLVVDPAVVPAARAARLVLERLD